MTKRPRILFVDDDRRALEGLKRMTDVRSSDWDMVFVPSGVAAIERAAAEPFDVVVADLNMPGIDGLELLERMQVLNPHAARMILSEHSEEEFTLRALDVAHQLIARPCDGAILVKTITRTLELRSTFENASLLKLIAETAGLPALPRSYSQLCARLRDPNCTIDDLVHWIEEDPALSLSLLRIANSAFFGRFRTVSGIREAVLLVGTRTLRNLVLAEGAFSSLEDVPAEQRSTVQSVYSHSVQVARVAARMLPPGPGRDQAFAAGLLHDVGKLLLATRRADLWSELQRRGAATSASAHVLERDLVGVSHAEIGGYLLALWGLPHPVVEAVTWHHEPARYGAGTVDPSIAVIVSNALVHSVASGSDGSAADLPPQVEELLAVRRLESRMEEWRDIAANLLREAA